jgi:hypothetical protein
MSKFYDDSGLCPYCGHLMPYNQHGEHYCDCGGELEDSDAFDFDDDDNEELL